MSAGPDRIVKKPRLLFQPDPVIGWRLTPGHGVAVQFRDGIVQHIGPDGWRQVPGAAEKTGPRLGLYGCSFTYGTGLADDETFAAHLQQALPGLRILNRGIGGHGTVQNYLQLRRDIANGSVDTAVFAIISDHRFRNIAHPQRMRQYQHREWYVLGVEHVPVVRLNAAGQPQIRYVPIWQPLLNKGGLETFLPDEYMITTATLAVLAEVRALAAQHALPLRFALLDQLDPDFNTAVTTRFPDTLDISQPHDGEHRFLPRDIHPNVRAAKLYASGLAPAVEALCADLRA